MDGERCRTDVDPVAAPPPHVLRDYAFLADGHRGLLIGPEGDCGWMCFPGWGDGAVFATLIGSGGHYTIRPRGRWVWGGFYEDGTLIWTSRWITEQGAVESREALARPAGSDRAVFLRQVRSLDAPGSVVVVLDPRADYGRRPFGRWQLIDGCWEAPAPGMVLRWWGGAGAVAASDGLVLELPLAKDRPHDFVLEFLGTSGGHARAREAPDPAAWWRSTEAAWRAEVPDCEELPAARDVRRSWAVLRGMTGPTGGTVAAATTSLPERAGADRNYDYRYVWVRDTSYIGRAGAFVPGGEAMLDDAARWVTGRLLTDGDMLCPAYTTEGDPVPDVEQLDLPGYPGGTDIIGNRVRDQFQLDAFGESLLLLASAASQGRLDVEGWEAAEVAAKAIERRWTEPDAGIWELEPRNWTHSRLACVAGLRAICQADAPAGWSVTYLALADEILARTAKECVHPSGRWQRAPDDPRVDAALLLAEVNGAVDPHSPRSRRTRSAVVDELTHDRYVYRYRHDGAPLGDAEGAFLICSFWLALAHFGAGDEIEGVRWFERARSSAGSPGLLAEEFDVVQHQLRGNLPQAFVHALLIECAARQRTPRRSAGAAPGPGGDALRP
jgi:alpha,alpha-trehalase